MVPGRELNAPENKALMTLPYGVGIPNIFMGRDDGGC